MPHFLPSYLLDTHYLTKTQRVYRTGGIFCSMFVSVLYVSVGIEIPYDTIVTDGYLRRNVQAQHRHFVLIVILGGLNSALPRHNADAVCPST